MMEWILAFPDNFPSLWYLLWTGIKIACILLPLMIGVAYMTYAERKIIGYMQLRIGPNRVGPVGFFQPFADLFKMLTKEIVFPAEASKRLFIMGPILFMAPSFVAWAVVPFSSHLVLADVNAGLLFLLAMTSVAVYGVIISGWASNSKYAFMGALRSASQVVSYELAMGFCLVGVLMVSGSMNLGDIVDSQKGGVLNWNLWPLLPLAVIYWISGVAETNRAPFDLPEGESEIVAGYFVEYAGTTFALFFLAEYANMILIALLTSIMFLGGYLSPFEGIEALQGTWLVQESIFWLFAKASIFLFMIIWIRATFPRYRYDQIMRLGWKVFIPLTLVWVIVVALMVKLGWVG